MTSAAAARRPRVILTDPINPEAHSRLAGSADIAMVPAGLAGPESDAALRELARSADGLIVRRQLPEDLFEPPSRLRAVVRHGVGLDFIPVARANVLGIPVANTPAVNANAVAEYAMAAMLSGARRLAFFDDEVRRGNWAVRRDAGSTTSELRGQSVGVIGYGAIGRRIGEIAAHGFGMQVATHTTTPSRLPAYVTALSLEDLFAQSHFVVIACPLTEHTRGMVNANLLSRARPGAVLINVGRGPVVCEEALVAALENGRLGGAVLDVFEVQPLPMESRLRKHPSVVLTPHLAGITQDSERAMGLMAVDTVLALLHGERPSNTVNPEVYSRLFPPAGEMT